MSPARRGVRMPGVRVRAAALTIAAVLALTGLGLIWAARLAAGRYLYVSELGAAGEPTAETFRWALILVAVAAALVAISAPALSPRVRWLAAVPPALVLGGAALAFGIASQVSCTATCPLPVGPSFTWQDLIHTVSAVLGFAGAAFVMLQVAADSRFRRLARFSLVSAVSVAVIAAAGGLLSLLRFGTQVGGVLELVATTIALLWLDGLAAFLARATWSERMPAAGALAHPPRPSTQVSAGPAQVPPSATAIVPEGRVSA